MEKVLVTVMYKKVGPDETRKLQDDLFPSTTLQAHLYNVLQRASRQTLSNTNSENNSRQRLLPRKTDNGELTCGWQRSTSRRHSIRCNMMQSGDLSETIRSVSNTFALLEKLYTDQRATVLTDVESGTKQGDPYCSLLFSPVLQSAK